MIPTDKAREFIRKMNRDFAEAGVFPGCEASAYCDCADARKERDEARRFAVKCWEDAYRESSVGRLSDEEMPAIPWEKK